MNEKFELRAVSFFVLMAVLFGFNAWFAVNIPREAQKKQRLGQ